MGASVDFRVEWRTECNSQMIHFTLSANLGAAGWIGIGLHDAGTAIRPVWVSSSPMQGLDIVQVNTAGQLRESMGVGFREPQVKNESEVVLDGVESSGGRTVANFSRPLTSKEGLAIEEHRLVWLMCAYNGASDDLGAKHQRAVIVTGHAISLFHDPEVASTTTTSQEPLGTTPLGSTITRTTTARTPIASATIASSTIIRSTTARTTTAISATTVSTERTTTRPPVQFHSLRLANASYDAICATQRALCESTWKDVIVQSLNAQGGHNLTHDQVVITSMYEGSLIVEFTLASEVPRMDTSNIVDAIDQKIETYVPSAGVQVVDAVLSALQTKSLSVGPAPTTTTAPTVHHRAPTTTATSTVHHRYITEGPTTTSARSTHPHHPHHSTGGEHEEDLLISGARRWSLAAVASWILTALHFARSWTVG